MVLRVQNVWIQMFPVLTRQQILNALLMCYICQDCAAISAMWFMVRIRRLVWQSASQRFHFLKVDNIWLKCCCPEVPADESRGGSGWESVSCALASSSGTTVFDEEGEESLTHCCRHTYLFKMPCLKALHHGCSLITPLFTVAGRDPMSLCHPLCYYVFGYLKCSLSCPPLVFVLTNPVSHQGPEAGHGMSPSVSTVP